MANNNIKVPSAQALGVALNSILPAELIQIIKDDVDDGQRRYANAMEQVHDEIIFRHKTMTGGCKRCVNSGARCTDCSNRQLSGWDILDNDNVYMVNWEAQWQDWYGHQNIF